MSNYVTTEEAARRLGFKEPTLRAWRNEGVGPEFVRTPTGSIRYSEDALQAWITSAQVAK